MEDGGLNIGDGGESSPLTPSGTRALLERLGHFPVKKLGQNFLVDGNIVRKSLQLAGVQAGDAVVEVGPGLGTLTQALLAAGAQVYAVELDPRLAAHLRAGFGERLNLLEGDAVDSPLAGLPDTVEDFKIVANLPYAITSPWVDAVLSQRLPCVMVLMMQKEAADRLVAVPGSKLFGAISIFLHGVYRERARHTVSRQCFHPVPGVDSVLLTLERKEEPLLYNREVRDAVRQLFTQRRKQLGSLIRRQPVLQEWFAEQVAAGAIDGMVRPEDVPLEVWRRLGEP